MGKMIGKLGFLISNFLLVCNLSCTKNVSDSELFGGKSRASISVGTHTITISSSGGIDLDIGGEAAKPSGSLPEGKKLNSPSDNAARVLITKLNELNAILKKAGNPYDHDKCESCILPPEPGPEPKALHDAWEACVGYCCLGDDRGCQSSKDCVTGAINSSLVTCLEREKSTYQKMFCEKKNPPLPSSAKNGGPGRPLPSSAQNGGPGSTCKHIPDSCMTWNGKTCSKDSDCSDSCGFAFTCDPSKGKCQIEDDDTKGRGPSEYPIRCLIGINSPQCAADNDCGGGGNGTINANQCQYDDTSENTGTTLRDAWGPFVCAKDLSSCYTTQTNFACESGLYPCASGCANCGENWKCSESDAKSPTAYCAKETNCDLWKANESGILCVGDSDCGVDGQCGAGYECNNSFGLSKIGKVCYGAKDSLKTLFCDNAAQPCDSDQRCVDQCTGGWRCDMGENSSLFGPKNGSSGVDSAKYVCWHPRRSCPNHQQNCWGDSDCQVCADNNGGSWKCDNSPSEPKIDAKKGAQYVCFQE